MMDSRGTNNSLNTAPMLQTTLSGDGVSSASVVWSAGENVLASLASQASQVVHHPAGSSTGGFSPDLVALISQTVQASSNAVPSTLTLPSSSAAFTVSVTPPCSVGIPAVIPLLASSTESLLASGTGFVAPPVQGRPLVVPSFDSTFAPPSMSSSVFSGMTEKGKGKKEKRARPSSSTSDECDQDGQHYEELLAHYKALEQKDAEKSVEIAKLKALLQEAKDDLKALKTK
ncbi:hypothetical protein ACROYT_G015183 [Oculina patagonica]